MAKCINIDLGTTNTVITVKNSDVILYEPSVIAIDNNSRKILAAGSEAKELLGKTPKDVSVVSPIKDGVISDFESAVSMLKVFMSSILKKSVIRPSATVYMPQGITDMEKLAILEAVSRSGGRGTHILEAPLAAAISAGIPIDSATGNMILDIGGGRSCAAVISFGGIVSSVSVASAGKKMDNCILEYIKKNHNTLIGEKTAESIKIQIGSAYPTNPEKNLTVTGRDTKTGLPKDTLITSSEIREAISPVLLSIIDTIYKTLENTPAELIKDLTQNGIIITGGVKNLCGIAQFIEENTGIPARTVNDIYDLEKGVLQ